LTAVDIPGYKIKKTLGVGGQATVYLAIQEGFDREVALKVMSPALAADPTFGERFLREAKIVAKLSHKSIVTVYDVGEAGNFYYLAMEYLPGDDLKTRIQQGLKARECLRIISKLAKALHFAHEKGYIHRDVKSENILFRDDGEPLLTDFGIAKASNSSTQMTQTGKLIGTPEYMSPEQCRGRKVDGRSDLYSLGIILYEMLTRQVPFTGEDSVSVCIQHVTKPLPKLPQRLAHFQWLIDKMTAKDPADRFQTGLELAEAVDLFRATGKAPQLKSRPRKAQKPTNKTKQRQDKVQQEVDDHFDDLPNQRLVDSHEIEQKSGVGRVLLILVLLFALAGAGLSYQQWLPWLKSEWASLLDTQQQTNSISPKQNRRQIQSEVATKDSAKSKAQKETAENNIDVQKLLADADALMAQIPHQLENLKKAHALLQQAKQLNVQSESVHVALKNLSAIALEEASKSAKLNDFERATEFLAWVEFVDPQNALLAGTAAAVGELKANYDAELLARQQLTLQLAEWLKQAQKALQENRLTAPEKDNAIYYFQQILQRDPDNEEARSGLLKTSQRLAKNIEATIAENQFAKARTLMQRLASISATEATLDKLRNKLIEREKVWKQQQALKEKQRKQREAELAKQRQRQQLLSDPAIQLRLQALFDSALSLEQEGKLVGLADQNAAAKYRAILAIDAQNEEAHNALKRIEDTLIDRITSAISAGQRNAAEAALNELRIFNANHPMLSDFSQEIEAMLDNQVTETTSMSTDSVDEPTPSIPQDQIDETNQSMEKDANSTGTQTDPQTEEVQKDDPAVKEEGDDKDDELSPPSAW